MWIAIGIILLALIVMVFACFKVSGDCSREEERREHEQEKV